MKSAFRRLIYTSVYTLILITFFMYWLLTFNYVMPNNYIRIEMIGPVNYFEKYFYQRWAFFAPPPKSNNN
jgi:hypothetical protein